MLEMRPEFRRDPLYDRWVVFSPERQRRPIDFAIPSLPVHTMDPFAPGHERLTPSEVFSIRDSGKPNEKGWRVRIVPNRFPAVRIEGNLESVGDDIYDRMTGIGAHEVIIETPDVEKPFEALPVPHIAEIFGGYRARILDLNKDSRFQFIYVFKNVRAMAGASLRHAHSQLIAMPLVPPAVEAKLDRARAYFERKRRSVFTDILNAERKAEVRVIAENDGFVLFCPYASRFPFEMAIFPKRHQPNFADCQGNELTLLAEILKSGLTRLHRVLEDPAYNVLLHTAPLVRPDADGTPRFATTKTDYCWHLEILPRLGFLAGFELGLDSYMNTVFPEDAARFLRGEAIK